MAIIVGTTGRDTLMGGGQGDTLTGGVNADTFVYSRAGPGHVDVITDFGVTYFSGPITGAQEVPANSSAARGTVTAMLTRDGALSFKANITGLDLGGRTTVAADDVTAAHFHAAAAGVSGGVVFGFVGLPNNEVRGETVVDALNGTVTGKWDPGEGNGATNLTAQMLNLLGNRIYINFHTAPFPAGEIRGQLIAQDSGFDRIDLKGTGITDWAALQPFLSEVNGSTRLTTTLAGQSYGLELAGVARSTLTASDFIYDGRGAQAGFTANQLITQFLNTHSGLAPTATQLGVLQNLAVSSRTGLTEAQTQAAVIKMADADTAVAVTTYAFFTGTTPSQQGLNYLVNSSLNPTDLNDAYYRNFGLENRVMNFAGNLALNGEGAARFTTNYGTRTFDQTVDAAYGEIVGLSQATAAGINTTAALADIKARLPAFQALARAQFPTANLDAATKAVAVGYILGEALKADVGVYARASDNFLLDLTDGGAAFGVNLVGVYGNTASPMVA